MENDEGVSSDHQRGHSSSMKTWIQAGRNVPRDYWNGSSTWRFGYLRRPRLECPTSFRADSLNVVAMLARGSAIGSVKEEPNVGSHLRVVAVPDP